MLNNNTIMIKNNNSNKVYILLSGGIDSMACLHFFKTMKCDIECINIDYGQKANTIEKNASHAISSYFGCPIIHIECTHLPLVHSGEIIGRNALLVIIALFIIQQRNIHIATGIHAGTNYVDCSLLFEKKMQNIIDIYTDGRVKLINPFIKWTKKDIWDYCIKHNLPIHLTYSCEQGIQPYCGKCLSCKDLEILKNDFSKNTTD